MAIIDWPTDAAFKGASFSLALEVAESVYTGFLTGNRERLSNAADRLRGILTLPPRVSRADAGRVEALLFALKSNGDTLRMPMPHRRYVLGTVTGTPTIGANASAGARSVVLAGSGAAKTLLAGDLFGVAGNLLHVAYAGGLSDGAGAMTVPLTLPLQRGVTSGATVQLVAPTGLWELDDQGLQLDYSAGNVQGGIALPLRQVIA